MRLDLPPQLEAFRTHIEETAAPCIALRPADRLETGGSRLGGAPRLVRSTPWPRSDRGPLSFVGQLDFRDLSAAGGGALGLPTSGVLSLFYDVEDPPTGHDPAHASGFSVIYVENPEDAVEVDPPDGTIPFDEEVLIPVASTSIPWSGDSAVSAWLGGAHRAIYREFHEQLVFSQIRGIPALCTQVFGHPQWLTVDGRVTAELAANGVLAGLERRSWLPLESKRALVERSNWHLLWQLKPNDDRFTWVDIGTLFVLIRDEDLRARRFERSWVVFQTS